MWVFGQANALQKYTQSHATFRCRVLPFFQHLMDELQSDTSDHPREGWLRCNANHSPHTNTSRQPDKPPHSSYLETFSSPFTLVFLSTTVTLVPQRDGGQEEERKGLGYTGMSKRPLIIVDSSTFSPVFLLSLPLCGVSPDPNHSDNTFEMHNGFPVNQPGPFTAVCSR